MIHACYIMNSDTSCKSHVCQSSPTRRPVHVSIAAMDGDVSHMDIIKVLTYLESS